MTTTIIVQFRADGVEEVDGPFCVEVENDALDVMGLRAAIGKAAKLGAFGPVSDHICNSRTLKVIDGDTILPPRGVISHRDGIKFAYTVVYTMSEGKSALTMFKAEELEALADALATKLDQRKWAEFMNSNYGFGDIPSESDTSDSQEEDGMGDIPSESDTSDSQEEEIRKKFDSKCVVTGELYTPLPPSEVEGKTNTPSHKIAHIIPRNIRYCRHLVEMFNIDVTTLDEESNLILLRTDLEEKI